MCGGGLCGGETSDNTKIYGGRSYFRGGGGGRKLCTLMSPFLFSENNSRRIMQRPIEETEER